jgi:hypothetical protein
MGTARNMRGLPRQVLCWVAIYAVAVHTLLAGIAPPVAAAPDGIDPLSVICLHDAGAGSPADRQPVGMVPGHACEHCNLCNAAAPPPAPDIVLIGNLTPARLLHVLRPASHAPSAGIAFRPNLARGPPPFA